MTKSMSDIEWLKAITTDNDLNIERYEVQIINEDSVCGFVNAKKVGEKCGLIIESRQYGRSSK